MPLPSNQGLLSPAGLNQKECKALPLNYMGHCKAMPKNVSPNSKAREKTKLNQLWVYPQLIQELHTKD